MRPPLETVFIRAQQKNNEAKFFVLFFEKEDDCNRYEHCHCWTTKVSDKQSNDWIRKCLFVTVS